MTDTIPTSYTPAEARARFVAHMLARRGILVSDFEHQAYMTAAREIFPDPPKPRTLREEAYTLSGVIAVVRWDPQCQIFQIRSSLEGQWKTALGICSSYSADFLRAAALCKAKPYTDGCGNYYDTETGDA